MVFFGVLPRFRKFLNPIEPVCFQTMSALFTVRPLNVLKGAVPWEVSASPTAAHFVQYRVFGYVQCAVHDATAYRVWSETLIRNSSRAPRHDAVTRALGAYCDVHLAALEAYGFDRV
jgi:hypothetical protein